MKQLLTKSLSLILSLCLAAALLTGCDNTSGSSGNNAENADSNTSTAEAQVQPADALSEGSLDPGDRSGSQGAGTTSSLANGGSSSKVSSRKESSGASEESSEQGSSALTEYQGRILKLSQNILDMNDSVNDAVASLETAYQNKDQETYRTSLDTLTDLISQLKDAYAAIAEEPAPEGLEDKKADLETACSNLKDMLDLSMRIYELGYKGLGDQLTDDEVSEMTEDQTKLTDLEASTDDFQNALTAILNMTDEDLSESGDS